MMALSMIKYSLILVVCFSLFTALSESTFISDATILPQVASQRRLLQVAKTCPVNFENQNYSIITSQCKGPVYSPELCCSSFKEFACPFADELNDLTNDCAVSMFSYININGGYPNGLFASLCREGKDGLTCPAEPPSSSNKARKNGGEQFIVGLVLMITLRTCLI